jgi:TetR/AcrR family transcriptional repressor of nem operon
MRYEAGHKDKSRTHIVRSAAAQLRARGVEGVRLADMMQAAGMTNGGFYKHFKKKDEIVVESVCSALNDLAEQLTGKVQGMPRSEALQSIIKFYLSEEHLRHPEHGCAIAALGSELARMPLPMKRRVNDALDAYAERLSPLMPGVSDEQRHTAFRVLFSSMAGCLTAARAEADEEKRRTLLRAGRSFFVQAFCGVGSKSNQEMWQ